MNSDHVHSSPTHFSEPTTPTTTNISSSMGAGYSSSVFATPRKRLLLPAKKVFATRIDPCSLYVMMYEHDNLLNAAFWKEYTHILFNGLDLLDRTVILRSETIRFSSATWLPWLKSLKKHQPHLKIYWSLGPLVANKDGSFQNIYNVLKNDKGLHGTFWISLNSILKKVQADGFELILEACTDFSFPFNFEHNKWADRTIVTLPNDLFSLKLLTPAQCLALFQYSEYVLLNSFGYFQYLYENGTYQILPTDESGLKHYTLSMSYFPANVFHKLLMGFDTRGTLYEMDPTTEKVKQCKPIGYEAIHRDIQLTNNWEMEWPTQKSGTLLKHKNKQFIISYDNQETIKMKLNYFSQKRFAGIVMGNLFTDIHWQHPHSLFDMCKRHLAKPLQEVGIVHDVDDTVSPQPTKRVRVQQD